MEKHGLKFVYRHQHNSAKGKPLVTVVKRDKNWVEQKKLESVLQKIELERQKVLKSINSEKFHWLLISKRLREAGSPSSCTEIDEQDKLPAGFRFHANGDMRASNESKMRLYTTDSSTTRKGLRGDYAHDDVADSRLSFYESRKSPDKRTQKEDWVQKSSDCTGEQLLQSSQKCVSLQNYSRNRRYSGRY